MGRGGGKSEEVRRKNVQKGVLSLYGNLENIVKKKIKVIEMNGSQRNGIIKTSRNYKMASY